MIRLRPDNFTPLTRTPWAGTRLLGRYKRELGIAYEGGRVGESWELSASDELPTQTLDGRALRDVLGEDPAGLLGHEAARGRATSALLVKWLDADDMLSLQIHPRDDYPRLASDEAGKLEAWYFVSAEPDAGFYFGVQPGVSREDIRRVLASDGDLRELMRWVPAQAGDFALIEVGVPHAVGRGLSLIEPQRVLPGKRGVTYRYWDFGRRYDARGQPSASGQPRTLHVDDAIAVTALPQVGDEHWLSQLQARLGWPAATSAAALDVLCGSGEGACVHSELLLVARLTGTGTIAVPDWNALRALTVIEGSIVIGAPGSEEVVRAGCTVALPANSRDLQARLDGAHALLSAVAG